MLTVSVNTISKTIAQIRLHHNCQWTKKIHMGLFYVDFQCHTRPN